MDKLFIMEEILHVYMDMCLINNGWVNDVETTDVYIYIYIYIYI